MGHQHQFHWRELPQRPLSHDAGDVHQSSDPRQGRGELIPVFHSSQKRMQIKILSNFIFSESGLVKDQNLGFLSAPFHKKNQKPLFDFTLHCFHTTWPSHVSDEEHVRLPGVQDPGEEPHLHLDFQPEVPRQGLKVGSCGSLPSPPDINLHQEII